MPGGILAFDLSSHTGVAYCEPGLRPVWDVWHLIGIEGQRFAAFENELADKVASVQPSVLVVEAPLSLGAKTSAEVVNQQRGLRAFVYSEGYRSSIRVFEIDAYTVRLEVLGSGRFKKGDAKPAVLAHCRSRGWAVTDHNAADAVLLLDYYAGLQGWRLASGPKL